MIFDKISNSDLYCNVHPLFNAAFEYLKNEDLQNTANGVYELSDGMKAIFSEYEPMAIEKCKPETHKKYIDIQFLISGKEMMGFAPLKNQSETEAYNNDKDVAFFNCPTSLIRFKSNEFFIFFPEDIHQPGVEYDKPSKVKKVVLKIPVIE